MSCLLSSSLEGRPMDFCLWSNCWTYKIALNHYQKLPIQCHLNGSIDDRSKSSNWSNKTQTITIIFSTVDRVSGSRSPSLLLSGSTFWVLISGSPFTRHFHQSIWSCLVKRMEIVFWSSAKKKCTVPIIKYITATRILTETLKNIKSIRMLNNNGPKKRVSF